MDPLNEPIPWTDYLLVPLEEALVKVAAFLPSLIGALAILVVGWTFARLVRWFLASSLEAARFDAFAQRTRLNVLWTGVGSSSPGHIVVARLVSWIILVLVFFSVIDTLQITALASFTARVVGALPDMLAGAGVLVVGLFIAARVRRLVAAQAEQISPRAAPVITTVAYWLVLSVVLSATLHKLGIDTTLVENLFTVVVACVGLAFALAFGLAGQARAGAYLDRLADPQPDGDAAEPEDADDAE